MVLNSIYVQVGGTVSSLLLCLRAVRVVLVGIEADVSDFVVPASRQPRVQTSDGLFHFQTRMQDEVLGSVLQRVHGEFRLFAVSCHNEPAVPLCSRRLVT